MKKMKAERRQSLIVPREHGAWGILLVPLVTGAAAGLFAGGRGWPLVPLSITALALFWLRTPLESWVGSAPIRARSREELTLVRQAVLLLSLVSMVALAWLFWAGTNAGLLWIGAAAGAAFLGQALLKQAGRGTRTASQIVGAAGLTAAAAAAYYVVTGRLSLAAWSIWGANLLFAANQIVFVQLRIRAAQAMTLSGRMALGRGFLVGQLALIMLLAAACGSHLFSWYAALAFAPVLCRGFAWFFSRPGKLAIHALGKRELLHAAVFAVLLVAGLQLA